MNIFNNPNLKALEKYHYDVKDRERAERILQKSEAACLISNSIISKITMEVTIKIET